MSRLSIEISPKQHQHIKALAAMEGQSIKEFVMSKLFSSVANEDESYEEFKTFLHERIDQARNGNFSKKSATQIANDALGKRD